MRLITLNLWGGQIFEPLIAFIKKRAIDTDIFCFQEVSFGPRPEFTPIHHLRVNLFTEIAALLPDFTSLQHIPYQDALYFQSEALPADTAAGQAMFVRKSLAITDHGGFRTYHGDYPKGMILGGKITASCQWVEVTTEGTTVLIANLHGLWQEGSNKTDTPERLTQSKILTDFLGARVGKKILCGDFNLLPDGKSMKILERNMKNLIKDFSITSTRSELYTKPEKFADYVLVSPDIEVKDFKALPDVVSDHLPLALQFT